jgi:hypothetical protein
LRRGWASLDFADDLQVKNLRRLLDTLQIEILATMESYSDLRDSPEFELCQLSARQPSLLDEIAGEQSKLVAAEIAQLELEAAQLQAEIAELSGNPEERIA